jgi:prepilin-type processing-associated H-X9-DG protein
LESAAISQERGDGATNALFFDGHAASVPSRQAITTAGFAVMYGFPGTVNPKLDEPPSSYAGNLAKWNMLTWR